MQIESTEVNEQQNSEEIKEVNPQQVASASTNNTSGVTSCVTSSYHKPPCGGCGKAVTDSSFLLVDDLFWHVTCLKCSSCEVPLSDETTCFVRNGSIFCREHYQSFFISRSCARCETFIKPHELVMRVRDKVYHAADCCFCCNHCERPLVTGEKFIQEARRLFCLECYRHRSNLSSCSDSHEIGANKPGRPRKTKHSASAQRPSHLPVTMNYEEELHGALERRGYELQKSKRIRTSFKHHQLCAMKAYFDSNHNPDAKDLKQLAQETGLSKRVLQVWFQNARAKYRRSCLQNESKSESASKTTKDTQLESRKLESCMDLSCSDSLSSAFEVSPVSESTSEETRPFYDDVDSEPMTSYSDYPLRNRIDGQLSSSFENIDCTLTSLHTSSPVSSLTSSV